MSRSPLFERLTRAMRIASVCDENDLPGTEGGRAAADARARFASRREFLVDLGRVAAVGAFAGVAGSVSPAMARPRRAQPRIGIVGAGLAGLTAARELRRRGVAVTLYDANTRVGGRQWSDTTTFAAAGQSCELGGELIDTGHHAMRSYATEFGLDLEVMWGKPEGDTAYYFGGALHAESEIVDDFRAWVANLRSDLQNVSSAPTADAHNGYDVTIDNLTLAEYLTRPGRSVSPLLYRVIEQAYLAEYGLAIEEQSPLNLIEFIRANNRAKFRPFGVSNEKYRVIGGNDQIARRVLDDAVARGAAVELGKTLLRIRQLTTGEVELTLGDGTGTQTVRFDAAIIAIPFTTLRTVDLDQAGAGGGALSAWKKKAIDELGYGTNAKQMVQFVGQPWLAPQPPALPKGSNGAAYADLANLQATWHTDPAGATGAHAIITDYSSAGRGATLDSVPLQTAVALFAADFATVYPGATAATRPDGSILAVREAWPVNPFTKGSYTCYRPGQFTTIAGNEGKAVANLHFAGEHANSFYEWQGFMEGACLSGFDVAAEILADVKAGKL